MDAIDAFNMAMQKRADFLNSDRAVAAIKTVLIAVEAAAQVGNLELRVRHSDLADISQENFELPTIAGALVQKQYAVVIDDGFIEIGWGSVNQP
jgi:hypothetical protein